MAGGLDRGRCAIAGRDGQLARGNTGEGRIVGTGAVAPSMENMKVVPNFNRSSAARRVSTAHHSSSMR